MSELSDKPQTNADYQHGVDAARSAAFRVLRQMQVGEEVFAAVASATYEVRSNRPKLGAQPALTEFEREMFRITHADPGIAVYKTSPGGNLDEQHASVECVTCGQTFSLNDPEAVAYHDQEAHEARP